MKIIEHSIRTEISPEIIWKLWEDVEGWKTWDEEIEFSRIDGPFQSGTTGETKFKSTPACKTLLTQVEPLKLVVQEASVAGAKIVSYQIMKRDGDITHVTFRVEVEGKISPLYLLPISGFIKKKVPVEMEKMLEIAAELVV